ncbi:hypothetical protein KTT_38360 [Tengunoibacter tsumagoiensis]|uniref:Uncharacterized protein n=1 Tax=Tengunoibacter tsumagoiensis TaxID=2014871 RepID=A0A402A4A5_9CHLR|nr:hypothetical protein KTT_38360 [Tengunoibacter tsumagoiensis]
MTGWSGFSRAIKKMMGCDRVEWVSKAIKKMMGCDRVEWVTTAIMNDGPYTFMR